ncbi:MAG: glycosyltransferase involved in cell wall biosynthesis [Psychromonas sp.]|jgi:glycosyltransferase involved in cell wall biosynthesis|uniref:glycosyltransferase family 4 protein n=1 Tax=Psychromonas sp. TaxID=1884585 RepID=UPI0039E6D8F3
MHICHVNLASGFSGGERQTLQLIKQQLKEGYQLTVVANPKSPFTDEIKKLPCKLVLASHSLMQHKKSITSECRLIHVHEGRAIYWAYLQSILFGIPYIVTRRIDNPLKSKWLSNKAYAKASALVGLSNAIVDAVKVRHPHANVHKIPSSPVVYPVNDELVADIRDKFDSQFIVIQAANLLKHKGHRTSIEAARLLQITHPNIHFVLLGDGPERNVLEKLASAVDNVTFAGKQSDMGSWFAAANLLIHPSYSEGLGSVILEAMAAGLPVVASDAGGIPDIIDDGISGLLIEAGNSVQLAEAICRVESSLLLRSNLLIGANKKLAMFDIAYTSTLYKKLYFSISHS